MSSDETAQPSRGSAPHLSPAELPTALAELFAEVLGLDEVALDDDFFVLGGHSLTAVRFAALVAEKLGIDMSVRELFDHPSPAELASVIARGDRSR